MLSRNVLRQARGLLSLTLLAALALAWASPLEARDIVLEIWCPDLDGDEEVGFSDAALLVAAQGPCPTLPGDPDDDCPEDFNGNGVVGRLDLVRVLGHWGPCRCKGDLDGDGFRTSADLALMGDAIASGLDCRADIDHSGRVEPADLEIELVSWETEPDADPGADVNDVEGLDPSDLQEVFSALAAGRDCRAEITADGLVDDDDLQMLEELVDQYPECWPAGP